MEIQGKKGVFTPQNNSGSIIPNWNKKGEKHPDYKGLAVIENFQFKIAGWEKTNAKGNKSISLRFQLHDPAAEQNRQEQESDIPSR